jgi:hypothetical protein
LRQALSAKRSRAGASVNGALELGHIQAIITLAVELVTPILIPDIHIGGSSGRVDRLAQQPESSAEVVASMLFVGFAPQETGQLVASIVVGCADGEIGQQS